MCDTDMFYKKMCRSAFFRINLNFGAIGNEIFYTETPPEMIPGFIENIFASIAANLNLEWKTNKKEG